MSAENRTLSNAKSPSGNARALLEQFRELYRDGQIQSLDDFLSRHPHLADDKATYLDLVYEEFCAREEAGEQVDTEAFCRRYHRYHSSLRRLIATHDVLRELPSDTLDAGPVRLPGPGETILGYVIDEELGRGAFARVCTATETAVGNRKVVIKIARGGGNEAGILGQLDHPNIVPIHSVQQDNGLSVVCMPYLGRTTLCDVLDGIDPAKLPTRGSAIHPHCARFSYIHAVVNLARQLADALAYVHAKGITHRDIKPSNVLIADSGRAMVLDFNLSAEGDAGASNWGGTLPYMAPEQLTAKTADGASDVFSLGVVIYELLTGVHPFGPLPLTGTRESLRESVLVRQTLGARSLRQQNSAVQDDLADVVAQCLAIAPARRPSSSRLAQQLADCLSKRQRIRRWVDRHAFVLSIYSGLVALAVFAGGVWLAHRPPYSERELAAAHESFQAHRYSAAIGHATQAIDHGHGSRTRIEALLVRAKSHLRTDNAIRAATDLDEAEILAPDDGRVLSLRGFCYSLAGNHKAAIGCYEQAIRSGFRSAAIHNNVGCSYLQLGLLESARPSLDNAISLDPKLQAAFLNRALVSMRQGLRKPGSNDGGRADINVAIKLGPESAEVYKDAAWIVMLATKGSEAETVIGYLHKAVTLGADPITIRNDSTFSSLHADTRFLEAMRALPSGKSTVHAVRLLNPLD